MVKCFLDFDTMITRLKEATEQLENCATLTVSARPSQVDSLVQLPPTFNPGNTIGQYTFSGRCVSKMKKEKGSVDGRARAIRKALHEIFDQEELATRTPAGGGGKPPLSLAKLTAVQGKVEFVYIVLIPKYI